MPLNQTKIYNQLLDIEHYKHHEREHTLKTIFKRDIEDYPLSFRGKSIYPNKLEDHETTMQTLYNHLTRKVYDFDTYSREFDPFRSKRLHWVKDHLIEKCSRDCIAFSCIVRNTKKKRDEKRLFILNEKEGYVVVLAPYRDGTAYYLLTAYHMRGGDTSSIKSKFERRENKMF